MLQRFLGIRPEEKKTVLLFSLLAFSWALASSTGVALSDAFFLEHIATHLLSYTFALTGVGLFALSALFLYLINRMEIDQIFFRSLTGGMFIYITFFCLILAKVNHPLFWIAFKALCYITHIAFLSNFFTFLDQFFELQNAKRIFSILYSPIFLGMAVSGTILSLSSTNLGLMVILAIMISAILSAIFLLGYIRRNVGKIPDDHEEFTVIKTSKRQLFKAIITSPFTVLFLLGCAALQVILVITEFEYMSGLETYFAGQDPTLLTAFLGRLYFWGSLVNIFFGIFIYGGLVRRVGLNNVVLIVPIFFTALFSAWFFSAHLFLPILGFIAVEGLLNLLEDNNFNLLLNAVPLKLKNKIRITCEALLEPLGMVLSSFLLLFFEKESKILGLVIAFVFLAITILMRAQYTKGIFYNLVSHLIPFQTQTSQLLQKVSKREFKALKNNFLNSYYQMKESEQLFLMESAVKFQDLKFLEQLIQKTTKLGPSIKLSSLALLEQCPPSLTVKFLSYFELWMKQHPSLHEDFFFHLSKMNLLDVEIAKGNLYHPSPKVRGASLLALRQKLPRSYESKLARRALYELLISLNEEENLIAIQILKYERLKDFKSKIFDLLSTSSMEVKAEILKTLPYLLESHDKQYAPKLLKLLQDDDYVELRPLILQILKGIFDVFLIKELLIRGLHFNANEKKLLYDVILDQGYDAIAELESLFLNTYLPDTIRLMAAHLIGQISHKNLKQIYNRSIQAEIERLYFYYYHLKTLDKSSPYPIHYLLRTTLKNSFESVLGFVVQSIAYLNQFEKGSHLLHSLKAKNPKTYSHALETLQKICSTKLYNQLMPVIEDNQLTDFVKLYQRMHLPILTFDNLLDRLEQTPCYVNKTIVSLIRERFGLPPTQRLPSFEGKKALDHFTENLLENSEL